MKWDGIEFISVPLARISQQLHPAVKTTRSVCFLIFSLALASCSGEGDKKPAMEIRSEIPAEPTEKVVKTDAEWKKQLTAEQYSILRQSGTERANGEVYKEFKHQGKGTYHCAGCNALLFSSEQKFDSGCGWPSFYDPAKADNVVLKKDISMGTVRTEVVCAKCGGHLGHVFEGEGFNTPTDKRFCINGGGLVFVPAKDDKPAK
jgi:peptide-methionine (R)-S-oxide reductase